MPEYHKVDSRTHQGLLMLQRGRLSPFNHLATAWLDSLGAYSRFELPNKVTREGWEVKVYR